MSTGKYTLVQHSAYGYAGNPQFKFALEERSITKKQEESVKNAGGVVCANYIEASDLCEKWMYPPDVEGIVPDCKSMGTFSKKKKIDGLAIFVPTDKARGEMNAKGE